MKYEIVELPQMTFAGLTEVTSNSSPNMTQKIGGLWQKLGNMQSKFTGRTNQKAVGLYCELRNADRTGLHGSCWSPNFK